MKILNTLLISILLTSVEAMAMTAKVNDEDKKVYQVLVGDSKDNYAKPGLAVDVKYKSEHVDVGVSADVNITISTNISDGILKVNLRALKENTTDLGEQDLEFILTKELNSFPINFQVSSEQSGIFYTNLTMTVEGKGSRVIVVPIHIGTISKKINNKAIEMTDKGISISVSTAEEEIK